MSGRTGLGAEGGFGPLRSGHNDGVVPADESSVAETSAMQSNRTPRIDTVGRFAPTPSGRMHIGNVYAMLAAWLSAHAGEENGRGDAGRGGDADRYGDGSRGGDGNGQRGKGFDGNRQRGKVLLRIEDVDGPRAVKDADKWIMDDLHWLGLDWDGEPVYQSQRTEIYEEALRSLESVSLDDLADTDFHHFVGNGSEAFVSSPDNDNVLLNGGSRVCSQSLSIGGSPSLEGCVLPAGFPLVYPCFCSRADLRAASAPQEGDRFLIYPGTCRKLLAEHPDEVRSRLEEGQRHSLRIAVPEEGARGSVVEFDDRVFGKQRFDLPLQVGDTIIRRSDGIFSYQLAVVVDDLLMGVNDIVRGRDLLRSTALQIWIRRALIMSGFAAKYGIPSDGDSDETNNRHKDNRDGSETNDNRLVANRRGSKAGDCRLVDNCNTSMLDNARLVGNHKTAKPDNFATACRADTTPEYPAYAHLPLIDDPTGVRLAKRKHSLDIGALRADGVKPEQVIGYCAWLLGVRGSSPQGVHMPDASGPVAMSAREALECFTLGDIRTDRSDRILPPNWANEFDRRKNGSVA